MWPLRRYLGSAGLPTGVVFSLFDPPLATELERQLAAGAGDR